MRRVQIRFPASQIPPISLSAIPSSGLSASPLHLWQPRAGWLGLSCRVLPPSFVLQVARLEISGLDIDPRLGSRGMGGSMSLGPNEERHAAAALGYVAHMTYLLSDYLQARHARGGGGEGTSKREEGGGRRDTAVSWDPCCCTPLNPASCKLPLTRCLCATPSNPLGLGLLSGTWRQPSAAGTGGHR